MTKRFLLTIAAGVAAAFALTVASPAWACDCAKKAEKAAKKDAKPAEKPAASEKKAELGASGTTLVAEAEKCKCQEGKECGCEKGKCACKPKTKDGAKFSEAEKCKCKEGAKECG
jgi:hypothetical protein